MRHRLEQPALALLSLALALAPLRLASAMGLLERNHPEIAAGAQAFEAGRFDEALAAFERAAQERPTDARVHYDRALALHKLGRNGDARTALDRAAELDKEGTLAGALHYTRGNVAASEGQAKEAIAEYRRALRVDPRDEQARHNLEVLLRNLPPRTGGAPDGGDRDGGAPDAGSDGGAGADGGADAGPEDGGPRDGGPDAGAPDAGSDGGSDAGSDAGAPRTDAGQQDGGSQDGGRGDGGEGDQKRGGDAGAGDESGRRDAGFDAGASLDELEEPDGGSGDGGAAAELTDGGVDLSRDAALRLLDSLKSKEKNLQLWRFQKRKPRTTPSHAKDW